MDSLPAIKLPRQFTGRGFEIIGDPIAQNAQGSIWFQDGVFRGLSFPVGEDDRLTPATVQKWKVAREKRSLMRSVETLAVRLRENPSDEPAALALSDFLAKARSAVPRQRFVERVAKKILTTGAPPSWIKAQEVCERAAVTALMSLSDELRRVPQMHEVAGRMKELYDDDACSFLTVSSPENQVKAIERIGFGWLDRRGRGRPKQA